MNIYVGNLSYDATDVTIREAFESFGQVISARIIKDKYDELVKSHIPYVVHASTKPVLSEPFVPSRASGRTLSRRACAERTVYPSTVRQAHGSG